MRHERTADGHSVYSALLRFTQYFPLGPALLVPRLGPQRRHRRPERVPFVRPPYPPLTSEESHTHWLAQVYVAAHLYFDTFMANLGGLARSQVSVLRSAAAERCRVGIARLKKLLGAKKDLRGGRRSDQVDAVARRLHESLPDIEDLLGKALFMATDATEVRCSDWGEITTSCGGLINKEIRWPADPDRR